MLAAGSSRRPAVWCVRTCPGHTPFFSEPRPTPAVQGAMWVYESVVSPTLKQVSQEARKVPALQKGLDKLDAFTVRGLVC